MNFMSARKMTGLFVVLAAFMIVLPGFAQTGGVEGKATKDDGSLCVKCQITILRKGFDQGYKTKTNKKGNYVYIGLPPGVYKITLSSPEGKQIYYITTQIGIGDPTEVNFNLPKLRARAKQAQAQEAKVDPELAKQLAEQKKEQAAAKKAEQEFLSLKKYFEQANALFQQKDYKGAAAAYEKGLPFAEGKNQPVLLMRIADCYQKANENQQALETYQKAAKLIPDNASLHNNLGTLYAHMRKFQEAEAEFDKAAKFDPTRAGTYYFNIGAIMYNAGKMDAAAAAFKKVIHWTRKTPRPGTWKASR